jgi:hypothetical protein
MITQYSQKRTVMILQKTLTALYKNFIAGMCLYAIGMSLAYAGDVGQTYDWCDPTYCCNLKK